MSSRGELQKVEVVHIDGIDTRDVTEGTGKALEWLKTYINEIVSQHQWRTKSKKFVQIVRSYLILVVYN